MEGHGGGRGEGDGIWGWHDMKEDEKVGSEWVKSSNKVSSQMRAHIKPPTERKNWREKSNLPYN